MTGKTRRVPFGRLRRVRGLHVRPAPRTRAPSAGLLRSAGLPRFTHSPQVTHLCAGMAAHSSWSYPRPRLAHSNVLHRTSFRKAYPRQLFRPTGIFLFGDSGPSEAPHAFPETAERGTSAAPPHRGYTYGRRTSSRVIWRSSQSRSSGSLRSSSCISASSSNWCHQNEFIYRNRMGKAALSRSPNR